MAQKLTKANRVNSEKLRISKLTNDHSAHFKIILSHQIEQGFAFGKLLKGKGGNQLKHVELVKIFTAFGKFLDDCTRLTITEVEKKYGRTTDTSDGTYDPDTESSVQVHHFCLFTPNAKPNGLSDSVRLHGYFRASGGYFVVTRFDWFHDYHKS